MIPSTSCDDPKRFYETFPISFHEAARNSPVHLDVAEGFCEYYESYPKADVALYLSMLSDILSLDSARTQHLSLNFFGLKGNDVKYVINLLRRAHSVQYVDARSGNPHLTSEDIQLLERELADVFHIQYIAINVNIRSLPDDWVSNKSSPSGKIILHDVFDNFECLTAKIPAQQKVQNQPQSSEPNSISQNQPQSNSDPQQEPLGPYQQAIAMLREHRIPPIDLFTKKEKFNRYVARLRAKERIPDAERLQSSAELILDKPPLSVVDWAEGILRNYKMDNHVYDYEVLQSLLSRLLLSHRGDERTELLLALDIFRRHIYLVLNSFGFEESDCVERPNAVLKFADQLKMSGKLEDCDDLLTVYSYATQWSPMRKRRREDL
eukprot:PhF_6_TR34739/c0_g1_i2/m.50559